MSAEIEIAAKPRRRKQEKPTHYKVVCISMYTEDMQQLEAKVAELKRRGWHKANKSHLIRIALASVDVDEVGHHLGLDPVPVPVPD